MSLLAPYPPEDLDAFWADTVAEAEAARLDFHRSRTNDADRPGFVVETLSFRGMSGSTLNGWLAYPPGARRLPSFLWLAPYGRWSVPPNEYGTREGMTSLSFNFHGESSFHEEDYRPARGYFAEGAASPTTWVFRRMFQDALIASRVLEAQSEADEDRLGAMGMSQGAGISIWLGAYVPRIRALAADMPFLSAMRWVFRQPIHRYPLKELTDFMASLPLGRETVAHTVSYFDTVNIATRCAAPTLVSAGLRDPAVRPEQARAVFDALAGQKELVELDCGHDWYPSMIEGNRTWLLSHLG